MSDLEDRLARLSPDQRALLERLLRKQERPAVAAIQPRGSSVADLPLSFGQQRLWFLDRMEPGRNTYNVFDSVEIAEPVDPRVVERAIGEIVRRHEALRTTFAQLRHTAVQRVAPALAVDVAVHDVRTLPPEARAAETARFSKTFADEPFDLTQGPLLRAALLRSGDDVAVLLISMHHIVTDAWSLEVLQREFLALYAAFSAGRPSPLPPLPIQFGDFSLWQRNWLTADVRAAELAYWTQALEGAPRVLDLPMSGPRPAVPSYDGASQVRRLTDGALPTLRTLAQTERATMFMATLSVFAVLLQRYTGLSDVVVGTPVACRDRPETAPLIGFFVNTVVIRLDLSGHPTFREVLRRTRDVCLGAFTHQDLPFEVVVEALQPERDPSRNPLFQITFQCTAEAAPDDALDAGGDDDGGDGSECEVQPAPAKFDLAINIWDGGVRLRAQADYSTDLFEDAAIARLLLHFDRLLGAAALAPDAPVSRLALLADAERRDILDRWNDTGTAYPRDASLDQVFASQVAAHPSGVAVIDGDAVLTFAELDRRAARLAARLRSHGVVPGDLVGVYVPRSADLVTAILGIVKAGAAYVPLDPDYPAERLAFMVDDASLRVVVLGASTWPLPNDACVLLPLAASEDTGADTAAVTASVTAMSAAYVIYTSGSTGRPKGVVVPHRAIVRTVCDTNYITLDRSDRVAQASTASFDAATFEIWGALLNGATLVVTPQDLLLEPERFAERAQALGLTVLFVTTAVLNQVAARAPGAFASLRCLLFGGEAANAAAVRRVLETGPPRRLLHVYGPTESTTFTTFHRVDAVADDASSVPIGRPIANTSTYILDDTMEPVPLGVAGELYIGGDGLALGYLGDEALTRERFVPHPFANEPNARLYRSGDVAKYLPDGIIDFVGRRDGQVKIRGFRIELGEVEALLRAHADVDAVVAMCREDPHRPKQLVAYVVARRGRDVVGSDLRAYMARLVPAYMIPSAFVLLPCLPLTSNGKVDRAALPRPSEMSSAAATDVPRPSTATESVVSRIFAEVLGLQAVGIDAGFFEHGGHSLLATQVVSRVREALHVDLPLRAVFTHQTVSALAAAIDGVRLSRPPLALTSIPRVDRTAYAVRRRPDGALDIPDALKARLHLAGS